MYTHDLLRGKKEGTSWCVICKTIDAICTYQRDMLYRLLFCLIGVELERWRHIVNGHIHICELDQSLGNNDYLMSYVLCTLSVIDHIG